MPGQTPGPASWQIHRAWHAWCSHRPMGHRIGLAHRGPPGQGRPLAGPDRHAVVAGVPAPLRARSSTWLWPSWKVGRPPILVTGGEPAQRLAAAYALRVEDIGPYVALLPVLGGLLRTITTLFGHGLETRARRHAELIAALPEHPDDRPLRELLAAESQRIAEQGHARLNRRVSWSTVAALVMVLVACRL